jgi:hypothetical protein
MEWVRTSHELEGHGNSILIVGHFCGIGISWRGELRGDGLKESWKQARTAEVSVDVSTWQSSLGMVSYWLLGFASTGLHLCWPQAV